MISLRFEQISPKSFNFLFLSAPRLSLRFAFAAVGQTTLSQQFPAIRHSLTRCSVERACICPFPHLFFDGKTCVFKVFWSILDDNLTLVMKN